MLLMEWKARGWAYAGVAVLSVLATFPAALILDQRDLLKRHISRESAEVAWVVFLKPSGSKELIEESIRSFSGIQSIRFISKEEALETVGKDPVLSQSLTLAGKNPLPESFDIRWAPFYLRSDVLEQATQKIQGLEGVDHVSYDRPRIERLNLLQRLLHLAEIALLGGLWGGAVLLVVLVGRLLFFPQGAVSGPRILFAVTSGLVGGLAGAALSKPFAFGVHWRVVWAGAAAGLLLAALDSAFQE